MIALRKRIFDQIVCTQLVYNQCWEDYALDQSVLRIGPGDCIVTITSAGCNALNYLLFDPARIDAVDLNAHQTALLDLKLAALSRLCYEDFFSMFGTGRIERHREIYDRHLRPLLSITSRNIWDRRIDYFDVRGHGLYFSGLAGAFARLMNFYIDAARLRQKLQQLQNMDDVREQAELYHTAIAPRLWSGPVQWLLDRKVALMMLGVPNEQIREMRQSGGQQVSAMVRQRIDDLFMRVPFHTNYFWQVYLNGQYSRRSCPPYLLRENFDVLRERRTRIRTHTMKLTDFLRFSDLRFNVYVLLDHMDWMCGNEEVLCEEWRLILEKATPGARIIFRSGALSFEAPSFAQEQLKFYPELARTLHEQDRVGTYGSFYFATVGRP